jgi:hypothetical protein
LMGIYPQFKKAMVEGENNIVKSIEEAVRTLLL